MAGSTFEKDLGKLENIVSRLEEDEVTLDEAMKLFEEGIKLSRSCTEKLDTADRKIEILMRDKNGNLSAEPFEPEKN